MKNFKNYFIFLILLLVLQSCNSPSLEENVNDISLVNINSTVNNAVDLRPFLTNVKDQGQRDTCNVFAATSLMEFLIKKKTGNDIDLSESYIWFKNES